MKVVLGGQKLTGRIEGLDNLSVTHTRKGEGNSPTISFSSEMDFYDDGYDLLKARLVDAKNGDLGSVSIEIFDECCDEAIFTGVVNGTNIEWCEDDCFITAQAVERSDIADRLKCLRNTLVADDKYTPSSDTRNLRQKLHPNLSYCNELRPQFLHDILIVGAIIAELLHKSTTLIGKAITAIVSFLVDLFGDITGTNTSGLNTLVNIRKEFLATMKQLVTGCGRRHPSPLVRDYIQNVCDICGVNFSSRIFSPLSIYHNTTYLYAPVKKGHYDPTDLLKLFGIKQSYNLIEDNVPLKSGDQFLSEMGQVFNADYRIIGDTLFFERKDWFESDNVWKESNTMNIIDGICYSWTEQDKPPASAKFEYTEDLVDTVGDEARLRYNEIVSWKGFDIQEGIKEVRLPFGATRFRDDGIDRDVITFWNNFVGQFPVIGNSLKLSVQYDQSIIMQNGKTALPKLVIYDKRRGDLNAEGLIFSNVVGNNSTSIYQDYRGVPLLKIQNYAMMFNKDRTGNLYDFHKIDDPREKVRRNKTFDFTATFECGDLEDFDIGKNIGLPGGFIGTMENVTINYTNKTINIKGRV